MADGLTTQEVQPVARRRRTSGGDRAGKGRSSRRRLAQRRAWRIVFALLVALFLLGVLLALAAAVAWPARAELTAGRQAAVEAREALAAGDAATAHGLFARSEASFARAERRLTRLPVRMVGVLPLAGHTAHGLRDAATAGRLVASAAADVTGGLAALPNGLGAFAPEDGVIPLATIERMHPPLASALAAAQEANALLADTPRTFVLPQLAAAQSELITQVTAAHDALTVAEATARSLPSFLGAEGRRRYFFGAANPAEVRGTGGLIGAYAILTVNEGKLRLSDFRPHQELPVLPPEDLPSPNPDYSRRYDQFGAAGHPLNINMTPDFPSAATAILNLYEEAKDRELDGVIVADPIALEALMGVTGPARVPDLGAVTQDDVVAFVANEAYDDFDENAERKSVLGEVASVVLERFLDGDVDVAPQAVAGALGKAASGRHLQLFARDDQVQDGLERAGIAGALPQPPEGDFVGVTLNNAAANKADFYMDWNIRYEVWLEEGGDARATLDLVGRNHTPQRGPLRYVIGPNVDYLAAGDNATYVSLFCPPGCEVTHSEQSEDERWPGAAEDHELGYRTLSSWQWVPSNGRTSVSYTLRLHDVWTGMHGDIGRYSVRLQTPPLIRPATAEVIIHPPHPLRVETVQGPLDVDSGQAIWRGTLDSMQHFVLTLGRPPRAALSHRVRSYATQVREFWSRPISW